MSWITHGLGVNTRKPVLNDLIREIPAAYLPRNQAGPTTNADRIKLIREARSRYYDQPGGPPKPKKKRDPLCKITAAECNAWLRSLPPYIYGEN